MSNQQQTKRLSSRKKMQLILDEVARRGCIHFPYKHQIFTAAWAIENILDEDGRVELYRLKRGEEGENTHNYLDHPFWVFHGVALDCYPLPWPASLSEISDDVSHALATWNDCDGYEDGNAPTHWRFLTGLLDYVRSLKDIPDGEVEFPFSRKGAWWEYKEYRQKLG